MTHLLAADRVRFGRRRDLWIVVALVPFVLVVLFVTEFNGVITPPQDNFFFDPPDPVAEAQLHEQLIAEWRQGLAEQVPAFTFPASLVKVAGNLSPMVLLGIYLATALFAGEFEWGTVRTIHLTSDRGRTMAVRIGVVVGLVAVATAVALAFAAVIPFLLSVEGRPLQDFAAPVPDVLAQVGIRMIAVLPFISIAALMAVVGRSTGFAIVMTLLFVVADLAVTGIPLWPGSPVPWVPVVTATGSINRLLGDSTSYLAGLAPMWVSVAALLTWSIAPAVGVVALFRRQDINE